MKRPFLLSSTTETYSFLFFILADSIMEGAASVIAVVSLALQSTQTINNIVSGFRNASPTIEQMTINLQDLSEVLKQINSYAHLLDDATELPKLVGRCADFLKTMEKKLGKLSSPTGDKAKNFWKNVKFTLQQSDLDRMAALLQHHIAVLSLQMNLVGGYVTVGQFF